MARMIFVQALGTAQIDAGEIRIQPDVISAVRNAPAPGRGARPAGIEADSARADLRRPSGGEGAAFFRCERSFISSGRRASRLSSDRRGVRGSSGSGAERLQRSHRRCATGCLATAGCGRWLPPRSYEPTHSEALRSGTTDAEQKSIFELCKAVLREVARAKSAGDWGTTERAARACLALDPLNEEATLGVGGDVGDRWSEGARVELLEALRSRRRQPRTGR